MKKAIAQSARPTVAVEIAPERVIAGRLAPDAPRMERYASRALPQGSVVPSLQPPNLLQPEAVVRALREALGAVAGRAEDVSLVVPDPAVRVALLDFETLPDRAEEAAPLIRFRLRKSVPFDVEQAAVSYQTARGDGQTHVLAVLMPNAVRAEYESAVREAGYRPGVLLPSTLAALGAVDATSPILLFHMGGRTMTTTIAAADQVYLFRSLDLSYCNTPEEMVDAVGPSLAFYEDTLNTRADQVLLAGPSMDRAFTAVLEREMSVRAVEVVDPAGAGEAEGETLPRAALAGVAGALRA